MYKFDDCFIIFAIKFRNILLMGIENTITKVSEMAGNTSPMGASIKFNFGDSQIVIDGTGDSNVVSTDDSDTQCTIDMSLDDFESMLSGELNPMAAFMGGQIQVSGDMSVAMKLQSLF